MCGQNSSDQEMTRIWGEGESSGRRQEGNHITGSHTHTNTTGALALEYTRRQGVFGEIRGDCV